MNALAGDRSLATGPFALKGPGGAFAVFALAASLALFPAIATMLATWTQSGSYHHGFVVAPIAFWLIVRRGPVAVRPFRPALVLVAASALFWLAGRAIEANIVEQLAYISLLIAGALTLFGPAWARANAFALAFLYLMVPFGTSLAPALQALAANAAAALLALGGLPATLDGLILTTSAGRFEVAEGCSGLNFLIASLLISALFAHLAIKTRTRALSFVAAALFLAIVANVVRVFLVIAIATWSDGAIAIAADHLLFGWALYGAMIAGLILIGRRFAGPPEAPPAAAPRGRQPIDVATLVAAIAIVGAAALAERLVVPGVRAVQTSER